MTRLKLRSLHGLLFLVAWVSSAHAFVLKPFASPKSSSPSRLSLHATTAAASSTPPSAAQRAIDLPLPALPPQTSKSKYLVLFKGGAAGNGDQGTSLACLRLAEFRGLAYREMGDLESCASLRFEDALKTDVSLAGGRKPDEDSEEDEESSPASSLMYVHGLPEDGGEILRRIVERAVLVHAAYEVWATGSSLCECAVITKNIMNDDPRMERMQANTTWAANSYVFGTRHGRRKEVDTLPQKLSIFKILLRRLPGAVDLKAPAVRFVLLEDGDAAGGEELHQVFFTREVAQGSRGLTERLSLRRRSYVTTTSMEPKASLVMSNVASLQLGEKVLDPMAGGGGLLLAAAQLGAGLTVGVDVNSSIDVSRVEGNFHDLGLTPPADFIFGDVGDPTVQDQLYPWGPFDVLVADPPYGKRERGPVRAEGAIQEAVYTLCDLAANNKLLRVGGRLVYFLPMDPCWASRDVVPLLPSHPCLTLMDVSRQPLNTRLDRYLITLYKHRAAHEGEAVIMPDEDAGRIKGEDEGSSSRVWHYN